MKNYQKPQFNILELALDKAIASSGLVDWLSTQGFDADATANITTYEVNS